MFAALAIATPALGVWIASSLAAYFDGPLWLALLAGALCFPILPLGWDALAGMRARRRNPNRTPVLTRLDRLILRTLAINVAFVGGLLAVYPTTVFSALSERGDWMLDEETQPWATKARSVLHAAADRMQWLHELTHPNAYEALIDPEATGESLDVSNADEWAQHVQRRPPKHEDGAPNPDDVFQRDAWPFVAELHPLVVAIPPEHEGSVEAIGRYFAEREGDPVQRLKAVHDYVADRIAYDVPAFETMTFPPQDAATVLRSGKGVCAGYAQLVKALGEAAGLEVVVVVGKTRYWGDLGHAWNAAKAGGKWYLLDATWDAGGVADHAFTKRYSSWYLMTPPDAFLTTHIPDDDKWQLREDPISLGEFMRRPDLQPEFYAWGLELRSPERGQVQTSSDTIAVELANPNGFRVAAQIYPGQKPGKDTEHCRANADYTELQCPIKAQGPSVIVLFGPDRRSMGKVHLTRSP
ncbi:MAG: transglutaminase domain-containing protein [Myxococcota bacterium]